MRKTWITSDQHFFHSNIIDICGRPFQNVEEMNESIIERHNSVVKNKQLVIHLGDFCFGNKDVIKSVLSRLNGDHVIILGNHDSRSSKRYFEAGFQEVYKYPILKDGFYLLSHKPVQLIKPTIFVNVHGHLHDTNMVLMLDNKVNAYYNTSVEQTNYFPVDYEEIREYYKV